MTMMLTRRDSTVKLNKRRTLLASTAVRKDPHLTVFLPCLTRILAALNHCAAILNILHVLNRPVEKTNTCSLQLEEECKQKGV